MQTVGKDMRRDVDNKEVGRKKNRAQHRPAYNSQPLCHRGSLRHSRALSVIPAPPLIPPPSLSSPLPSVIPAEAGIQIIKNY